MGADDLGAVAFQVQASSAKVLDHRVTHTFRTIPHASRAMAISIAVTITLSSEQIPIK